MKIYFLSALPCALFLNGAYFGVTNTFERFVDVSPNDRIFAELLPEHALPVRFFITEDLRFSPPDGCEVYLVKDGLAVYAREFPPNDFALKPILQKRIDETLVTVFKQGAMQVSFERSGELFVATLPPSFSVLDIKKARSFFLLEGHGQILLFNAQAQLLLCEYVAEYALDDDGITALLPLSDRLRRFADCRFQFTNDGIVQTKFTVRQSGATEESVTEEILPYAFFESVCIGADFQDMLSPTLREKADELRGFLGDFCSVTLTNDPKEIGLVYPKSERLFEVRYYRVEMENGKICDIKN